MSPNSYKIIKEFAYGSGRLTVLTGAGISAESNIPTFRGPEGYWTVGSTEYHFYMRCARECALKIYPIPGELTDRGTGVDLTDRDRELLSCPNCGSISRPHVLWFDETYNEHYYKLKSALKIAEETGLLLVVGTSGATNLPSQVALLVHSRQGIIVDINIEENPFSQLARSSGRGAFIKEPVGTVLPRIMKMFKT